MIPDKYNPLDWNRYSYARYNPVKYTDPTGHSVDCAIGEEYCRAGKWVLPEPKDLREKHSKFGSNGDYYSLSVYTGLFGKAIGAAVFLSGLFGEPTPVLEGLSTVFAAIASAGVTITIDRYGYVYVSVGFSAGRTMLGGEGSTAVYLGVGYINTPGGRPATPQEIASVLAGRGLSHGIASPVFSGNYSWYPGNPLSSEDFGFGWPVQVNFATWSFGFGPYDVFTPMINWYEQHRN